MVDEASSKTGEGAPQSEDGDVTSERFEQGMHEGGKTFNILVARSLSYTTMFQAMERWTSLMEQP